MTKITKKKNYGSRRNPKDSPRPEEDLLKVSDIPEENLPEELETGHIYINCHREDCKNIVKMLDAQTHPTQVDRHEIGFRPVIYKGDLYLEQEQDIFNWFCSQECMTASDLL